MGTLLYRNGGWHEQPQIIKPPQGGLALLSPAKLILEGTHHGYNKAIELNRYLGANNGPLGMSYLNHAKPLNSDDFPTYWNEGVFQAYLSKNSSASPLLLICFAGAGKGLNMPIPCFHSIAREVFDGIAYFFDEKKDYYKTSQAQVEQAVASLLEMSPWQRVALLGTSSGGSIALRFPSHRLIQKRLSASPPICRDPEILNLIKRKKFDHFRKSRIFFAAANKLDTRHFRHLKTCLPEDLFEHSVFNLTWASISHGTLATLMQLGALTKQLEWLTNDD